MGRNADAVVRNGKPHLLPQGMGRNRDDRGLPPIAGSVLQQLAQDEHSPLFIGIDCTVQPRCLHLDAALDQQGAVVFERLGSDFFQLYLPEQAILLRALRPGGEQRPLYMGFYLGQLRGQLPAGLPVQVPADKPGGGDGGFDLMHPLLHILPVLPPGCLRIGHRPRHGPARPAG